MCLGLSQVFDELNGDSWSSIPALRECIGDIQEDRDNAIMEEEMASQRGDADTGEVRLLKSSNRMLFMMLVLSCCTLLWFALKGRTVWSTGVFVLRP